MVTAVTGSSFISTIVLNVRDVIINGIVDPISGTRPTGQAFVMTSYPQRSVVYPLITVKPDNITVPRRLGMQSFAHLATVPVQVRIWSKSQTQKDTLSQNVINSLRAAQSGTSSTIAAGQLNFNITSSVDIDEEGDGGIKSRILAVEYKGFIGTD
jgi:hypothetical protein